jgi:hypothetical protein
MLTRAAPCATIGAALLGLLLAAGVARAEAAGPLRPEAGTVPRDGAATGALIWLHPFTDDPAAWPAPAWTAPLAEAGWDIWRLDRGRPDPLDAGAARLAEGAAALRARGYRRVALLGDSRGAFIALVALRHPGLADAVILAAPAAHGRSEARRPQALADFAAALEAARPAAGARLALLLFRDDPWDPDPDRRAALFAAAVARIGVAGLLVDRPEAPIGHGGLHDPQFTVRLASCLAAFLDPRHAPPAACP